MFRRLLFYFFRFFFFDYFFVFFFLLNIVFFSFWICFPIFFRFIFCIFVSFLLFFFFFKVDTNTFILFQENIRDAGYGERIDCLTKTIVVCSCRCCCRGFEGEKKKEKNFTAGFVQWEDYAGKPAHVYSLLFYAWYYY